MKLNLSIRYGDDGFVYGFLENEDGQSLDVGKESVDWPSFDTPKKAKKHAADILEERIGDALEAVSLTCCKGRTDKDLT